MTTTAVSECCPARQATPHADLGLGETIVIIVNVGVRSLDYTTIQAVVLILGQRGADVIIDFDEAVPGIVNVFVSCESADIAIDERAVGFVGDMHRRHHGRWQRE